MNKNIINKYLNFILGSLIMGLGIGACNYANLGVDPMSVLVLSTYRRFHVSFGMMNLIVSIAQLLIGYVFCKKNVTLATFISMVSVSVGIDAFSLVHLPTNGSFYISLIWLCVGIFVYCLGIALSELPQCGYTAYDVLIFGIQNKSGWSYHKIRWGVDLTFLVSGFLLGGPVGLGTIMILLTAGKLIEILLKLLQKYVGEKLCH